MFISFFLGGGGGGVVGVGSEFWSSIWEETTSWLGFLWGDLSRIGAQIWA